MLLIDMILMGSSGSRHVAAWRQDAATMSCAPDLSIAMLQMSMSGLSKEDLQAVFAFLVRMADKANIQEKASTRSC